MAIQPDYKFIGFGGVGLVSKVIMKLHANGDIETFGLPIVENDNLFVLATSTPGRLSNSGVVTATNTMGSRVSEFIPVEAGKPYTFQLYWQYDPELMIYQETPIEYSVQAYDANKNHLAPITLISTVVYTAQDVFSGSVPEGVAYIRVAMSHLDTGLTRVQVVEGSTQKPYVLSSKDLRERGLPFYSIGQNQITVPKLIKFNPDGSMPAWVTDTGNPISIFPEGIVIKGEVIESDNPPLPAENAIVYMKDQFVVTSYNKALHLSIDGGKTHSKSLSIGDEVGVINQVHVFSDGSLMFCSNTKCYYSSDFESYSESVILDLNDNPLVLTGTNNFSAYNHDRNRQIVDGVEMLVWGNYTHGNSASIRAWYTTDKGRTVKSFYQFNLEDTNACTHIHNVLFNPADDSFWLQTGDYHPPEVKPMAHFMKCQYDTVNDTWSIETIGSSLPFKSTNMVFVDDYAYWTWDTTGGGVVRCKYDEIADVSKHEKLFSTTNDCLDLVMSDRGEFIVTQSYFGGSEDSRYVWYSPDRINFHKVLTNPDAKWSATTCYYGIRGPNSEGKVLAAVANSEVGTLGTWDLTPSVFLDDLIREAGFPDAFKPL